MSFFKKIFNQFGGGSNDPIDRRAKIIKEIVNKVEGPLTSSTDATEMTLIVYTDDTVLFPTLDDNTFKVELGDAIYNRYMKGFKAINVSQAPVTSGLSKVCNNVYISIDNPAQTKAKVEELVAAIVKAIGGNINAAKKDLVILSSGTNAAIISGYKSEIKDKLKKRFNADFHSLKFESLGEETEGLVEVTDGVSLKITDYVDPADIVEPHDAVIEIFGHGSLIGGKVELEPNPKAIYNIGVGCTHETRTNHIAISDDPKDDQFEYNKYVSRTHAHIIYSTEVGYILYVEPRGTRLEGKRTRIIRDRGEIKDLEDTTRGQQLRDGDIIELSKAVTLIFKIVK